MFSRIVSSWVGVLGLGLLLGASLSATAAYVSDPSLGSVMPVTCRLDSMDFIDKRIDIGAQYSLMRKMAGDRESRIEATSIYLAIQDGRLAGIYLPPRKAVSDRGARMKPPRGYWDLIPKGEASTCLKQPAGEPPMILYRENQSKAQIDAALTKAWHECGLANVPEPCDYTVVNKPPPELECKTDQDCIDKQKGDFCNTDLNVCGVNFPVGTVIGPACVYPRCDTSFPTNFYAACGRDSSHVARACVAVPGEACGVCENVSEQAQACHEANYTRHTVENEKCRNDYKPAKVAKYSVECVKALVKCEGGSVSGCAKALDCMIDPKPYKEYRSCLNRESARFFKEANRCKKM